MTKPRNERFHICVFIEELLSKGKSIDSLIAELTDLNTRLDNLITETSDSWSGDAGTAYVNRMRSLEAQAVDFIQVLEEFRKYAENAATEFDSADTAGAAMIRGSF